MSGDRILRETLQHDLLRHFHSIVAPIEIHCDDLLLRSDICFGESQAIANAAHCGLSHPGDFCLAVVCAGITSSAICASLLPHFLDWSTISTIERFSPSSTHRTPSAPTVPSIALIEYRRSRELRGYCYKLMLISHSLLIALQVSSFHCGILACPGLLGILVLLPVGFRASDKAVAVLRESSLVAGDDQPSMSAFDGDPEIFGQARRAFDPRPIIRRTADSGSDRGSSEVSF